MFAEKQGHLATVTYTKIRKEYPKNDVLLQRTASNIKAIVLKEGGYVEWCGFLSEKKGKPFQCIVRYPMVGPTLYANNKWLGKSELVRNDVYELRHYLIRDGYLLEFGIFVPQFLPKETLDEDKYIDQWMPTLTKFVQGSSLVDEKDSYQDQVKSFKRPESYFRFVYDDPARSTEKGKEE